MMDFRAQGYSEDQNGALLMGVESNLDISVYKHLDYSAFKMHLIRRWLLCGKDITKEFDMSLSDEELSNLVREKYGEVGFKEDIKEPKPEQDKKPETKEEPKVQSAVKKGIIDLILNFLLGEGCSAKARTIKLAIVAGIILTGVIVLCVFGEQLLETAVCIAAIVSCVMLFDITKDRTFTIGMARRDTRGPARFTLSRRNQYNDPDYDFHRSEYSYRDDRNYDYDDRFRDRTRGSRRDSYRRRY